MVMVEKQLRLETSNRLGQTTDGQLLLLLFFIVFFICIFIKRSSIIFKISKASGLEKVWEKLAIGH